VKTVKDIKIKVFIQHNVDPELTDYLTKLDTFSDVEICGRYIVLSVYDPETIESDIRKIAREIDRINKVYEKVGYPWIARDILDGRAWLVDGGIMYKPKYQPRTLRQKIEFLVGPLTDQEYKEVLEATTDDIEINRIKFGLRTTIEDLIKIAAQCADVLKKCGEK